MEKVKVFVNLEKEEVTIQIIRKVKIFDNPARRFILESDSGGFSAIEKRDNGFFKVNFLRDRDVLGRWLSTGKFIEERKISEEETKRIIRETIKERILNPPL